MSATSAATNRAMGSTSGKSEGMPSATIFRNTHTLWRWSTMMSRVDKVWLSSATAVRADTAPTVGHSSWRKR